MARPPKVYGVCRAGSLSVKPISLSHLLANWPSGIWPGSFMGSISTGLRIDSMTQTNHEPEISVIICTYNRAHMLPAAVESLNNQAASGIPFEAIIVDNNSTD